MRLFHLLLNIRLWLVICVFATMLIGPASSDLHALDPEAITCQALDDQGVEKNTVRTKDGQSSPDHDHHVDACGSCHFHLAGSFHTSSVSRIIPDASVWPGINATAPRAGPFGLYRPPRV